MGKKLSSTPALLGYRMPAIRLPRWWLPALFGLIVAFWALRLLPGPFEWLASGRA